VPLYKYDLSHHPFQIEDNHRRVRYGYPVMAKYVANHDMGTNFVWCADIQDGIEHSLYVDQVHYTEEGNQLFADCIANKIVSSGAFERAQQRKLGMVAHNSAFHDVSINLNMPTVQTRSIASVFGANAQTQDLTMSKPLSEWDDVGSVGVRLADDSENFAMIHELFALERDPGARTHQVSIRVKPDTSDYLALVLNCVGGPHPQNFVLFVNPKTMGVIAASGLHQVRPESDGWVRLSLRGACNDLDNKMLQVMVYPQHGDPAKRGAIIFGGGEVVRVVGSSPLSTSVSPGR
jgi:hypothetical protein